VEYNRWIASKGKQMKGGLAKIGKNDLGLWGKRNNKQKNRLPFRTWRLSRGKRTEPPLRYTVPLLSAAL
jgi:hypothetical protein